MTSQCPNTIHCKQALDSVQDRHSVIEIQFRRKSILTHVKICKVRPKCSNLRTVRLCLTALCIGECLVRTITMMMSRKMWLTWWCPNDNKCPFHLSAHKCQKCSRTETLILTTSTHLQKTSTVWWKATSAKQKESVLIATKYHTTRSTCDLNTTSHAHSTDHQLQTCLNHSSTHLSTTCS